MVFFFSTSFCLSLSLSLSFFCLLRFLDLTLVAVETVRPFSPSFEKRRFCDPFFSYSKQFPGGKKFPSQFPFFFFFYSHDLSSCDVDSDGGGGC